MRKTVSMLVAAVVTAGVALLGVTAPAAAAAGPAVRFYNTQYDAPGKDIRTNAHINKEWISIINDTSSSIQLRGWTIRDRANHKFTFGTTTIKPHTRLLLLSGKGTPVPNHRYWGSGNYIWNNDGDTAYLRNASGTLIDTCTWGYKSGRTVFTC